MIKNEIFCPKEIMLIRKRGFSNIKREEEEES